MLGAHLLLPPQLSQEFRGSVRWLNGGRFVDISCLVMIAHSSASLIRFQSLDAMDRLREREGENERKRDGTGGRPIARKTVRLRRATANDAKRHAGKAGADTNAAIVERRTIEHLQYNIISVMPVHHPQ